MPIGIIRFFPLPNDAIPSLALPLTPPASTTAISPNFTPAPTHLPLPPSFSSLPDPVTPCHSNTYTGHAIPAHSVLKVLGILEEQIDRLVSVVENLEMRFIGASVLIVYEGDEKRLASALERYDAHAQVASLNNHTTTLHKALAAYDSDDEEDEEDGMYSGESSTSSDDDEDDGTRVDARRARRCPPVSLRLNDFAHTRLAEGEGPDEGVLLGLKSLVDLVNRRKEEVVTYIAFEGKEQERPGRGATLPDGEKHG